MDNFIAFILSIHVVSGALCLIGAPIVMLYQKGSKLHRKWGKVYFISMLFCGICGAVLSYEKSTPLLLTISIISLYLVFSGYRALFLKGIHKSQTADLFDWIINIVLGVFSVKLLNWGVLSNTHGFIGLSLTFGLLGLGLVFRQFYLFLVKPNDRNHWLFTHMALMIASYFMVIIAFSVVNFKFIPSIYRWLWPLVIAVPTIYYWVRLYKKRFDGKKFITIDEVEE